MNARAAFSAILFAALTFAARTEADGWDSYRAGEVVVSVPLGNTWSPEPDIGLDLMYLRLLAAINEFLTAAEFAELVRISPFGSAGSNEEIMDRFSAIRRSVLAAIHLIGFDEPRIADSLYSLYRNRRLSIASGSNFRIDAALREDGRRAYGDEALNVFVFRCPETPSLPLKYYDPDMVALINLLLYHGQITVTAGYEGAFPTTQITFAQWSLANQLREIAAAEAELERLDNLIVVLQNIIANLLLPPSITGLPYRIGDYILEESGLSAEQKREIARGLLLVLEGELRPRANFNLQQRIFYKTGLEYFIAGVFTQSIYNNFMKPTAWYQRTIKRDTGEFRRITTLAGYGSFIKGSPPQLVTDTIVRQLAARLDGTKFETTFSIPELANISGAWRMGNSLLVAGNSTNSQEGILRGYLDTNSDGIIEGNTGRELHRNAQFFGGVNLFRHSVSGNPMLFNRTTNKLFELTGSDVDGFPTGFVDRGTLTPTTTRNDLLYARLSDNADWSIGYVDYKFPTSKYTVTVEARYNLTDNKYAHYRLSYPFTESQVGAALSQPPATGATFLRGTGTPGAQMNAYMVNAQMTFLDSAQVDPNGHVAFNFATPLIAGDEVVLKDLGTNLFSASYKIPFSFTPRFVGVRNTGDGAVQFEAFGRPGYNYDFQWGPDLDSLPNSWSGTVYQTGKSFWEIGLQDGPRTFVVGAVIDPPLTGGTDYYRVAPGPRQEYHPQINDRYPIETGFSLVSPTNLDPERLSFTSSGSFHYAGLTVPTQGSFSLTYKMTAGQQNSLNIMVVLNTDYQLLVNPPVVRKSGAMADTVVVPCLVIGGKHYPMYQFTLANNPADNCGQPHWHRPSGMVFPLEMPTVGISDPNAPACGFGTVAAVPQAAFETSLNAWADFKTAHPPPF